MKPRVDCAPCMLRWIYERTASSVGEDQRYELMRTILGVLSREFIPSENLGLISDKTIDAVSEFVLASAAYYNEIKVKTNRAVEERFTLAARESACTYCNFRKVCPRWEGE